MKCPFCGNLEDRVVDSRPTDDGDTIRRRRECAKCMKRYTTYEKVEILPLVVIKKDNSRENFNRDKLMRGISRACEKRPVAADAMHRIVDEIETQLSNSLEREVSSKSIGELLMEKLKRLDQVAYVRFASVYRDFSDIDTFLDEIHKIRIETAPETMGDLIIIPDEELPRRLTQSRRTSQARQDARAGARPDIRQDAHAGTRSDIRQDTRAVTGSYFRQDARPGARSDFRQDAHAGVRSDFRQDTQARTGSDFRQDAQAGTGSDFRQDGSGGAQQGQRQGMRAGSRPYQQHDARGPSPDPRQNAALPDPRLDAIADLRLGGALPDPRQTVRPGTTKGYRIRRSIKSAQSIVRPPHRKKGK